MHFVDGARQLKNDLDKGVNRFHRNQVAPGHLRIYQETVKAFCGRLKNNIASLIKESMPFENGKDCDTYLYVSGFSEFHGVPMRDAVKDTGFSAIFENKPKDSQYQVVNFDFN